jgi:hypothetical protein
MQKDEIMHPYRYFSNEILLSEVEKLAINLRLTKMTWKCQFCKENP